MLLYAGLCVWHELDSDQWPLVNDFVQSQMNG